MNSEFVNYEQALALKELGFDLECLAWFDAQKKYQMDTEDPQNFNHHLFRPCVSRPLKQQIFRWFRDKHELFAYIVHFSNDKTFGWKIDDTFSYVDYTDGFYKTYEEAESACIDKLIEICQKKK